MNQARIRFYTTWIIFGFITSYALEQIFQLVTESVVFASISLNVAPDFVKYAKGGIKALLILFIIVLVIRLLNERVDDTFQAISLPRKRPFVLLLSTGIIASILNLVMDLSRPVGLDEYLERHNVRYFDFATDSYYASVMPSGVLFIVLVVAYFVLVSKKELS